MLFISLCVYYINMYACLCLRAFIRMCEHACNMAGRHEYKPSGVPYSEPQQSREDLHQTDYSTTTMTATNGRNKTLFNEDTNLRTITLCSEIQIRNININHVEKTVEERHGLTQECPTLFSCSQYYIVSLNKVYFLF